MCIGGDSILPVFLDLEMNTTAFILGYLDALVQMASIVDHPIEQIKVDLWTVIIAGPGAASQILDFVSWSGHAGSVMAGEG